MMPAIRSLKTKNWWLIVPMILLFACSNNDIYLKYKTIPLQGWNKDSICNFDIPVKDISTGYDLFINVRNRGEYPHQNLWLFIRQITPDSIVTNDTINFYLADQRGKWLGSGIGSVYEMPVIYQRNYHFNKIGNYHFEIHQGMRDSILVGINEIGIRVEKVANK